MKTRALISANNCIIRTSRIKKRHSSSLTNVKGIPMAKQHRLFIISLALGLLTICLPLPASAQFGFGFGSWNWAGHQGYGSWFGFSTWPNYGRPRYNAPSPRLESPRKEANGYLEGQVIVQSVCPASQPNVACPLVPNALDNVTVSAQPQGSSQWLASRPDAQGRYTLSLPPGSYSISLNHPSFNKANKVDRTVIIQPGRTLHQDFQIDLLIQ
jgi:hypothetical protein